MKAQELIKILSKHPTARIFFKDQYGEPEDTFEEYDLVYYPEHKAYLVNRKGVGEEYLD